MNLRKPQCLNFKQQSVFQYGKWTTEHMHFLSGIMMKQVETGSTVCKFRCVCEPSARQSPHSPLLSFPAHLPTCTSSPHQHRSDVPPVFGVSAICICIWSVPVCFLLPVLDLIRFGLFCLFNSSLPCPSGFVCLFGWSMVHVFGSYLTLWQWY